MGMFRSSPTDSTYSYPGSCSNNHLRALPFPSVYSSHQYDMLSPGLVSSWSDTGEKETGAAWVLPLYYLVEDGMNRCLRV